MKLKITLIIAFALVSFTNFGQEVPRKIIVEHFTNTLCGTCAARNPGFYNNYNNQNTGNMIHLTIHPSSPYKACILNKHDKQANDERTKYYGVFGSTPRLVINGSAVGSGTSFNSAAIFTPYVGLTSPVSLTMTQQKFGSDSMRVRIVVRTEAAHSLTNQDLYVVLAEDTIFYNAPNGEDEHYDVFRRALTGVTGMSVTIPSTVGDSVVIIRTTAAHADWDFSRIYALAILQDPTSKEVTQSESLSPNVNNVVTVGIRNIAPRISYNVYPNPATNTVSISSVISGESSYRLLSITGEQVLTGSFTSNTKLNISNVTEGVYFLIIENELGVFTQKMVKTRN